MVTLTLVDAGGQKSTHSPSSLTNANTQTYVTALQGWTDAKVISASETTRISLTADTTTIPAGNVDKKAVVTAKTNEGEVLRIVVPAPKVEAEKFITEQDRQGERITNASGKAFLDAVKAGLGITDTLEFSSGVIIQHS